MKLDEKKVPDFKNEVCSKCSWINQCNDKDNHWFMMCPKFFNWCIGFKSFVAEQLEYQREHPEEMEKEKEKNKKLATKLTKEKRAAKKKKKTE